MAKNPKEIRDRNEKALVKVVNAGLRFGLTNCKLARKVPHGGLSVQRQITDASNALEAAEKLMWKLKMSHPDFDQMMALCERLKLELESLQGKG